jgi:hypothetical protein
MSLLSDHCFLAEYGYAPHLSIEGLHKQLMGGVRVSDRNPTFKRAVLEIELQAQREIGGIIPQRCAIRRSGRAVTENPNVTAIRK